MQGKAKHSPWFPSVYFNKNPNSCSPESNAAVTEREEQQSLSLSSLFVLELEVLEKIVLYNLLVRISLEQPSNPRVNS